MRTKFLYFVALIALTISIVGLVFMQTRGGIGGRWRGTSDWSFSLAIIFVPIVFLFILAAYQIIFPELSEKTHRETEISVDSGKKEGESVINAVLRVLKDDENQVVETISDEGGTMLQKDIRWKTGFSRVRTHRILAKLIERGIVTAEKHYNTNKIVLAEWLLPQQKEGT